MNKITLLIALLIISIANAQYTEGFDDITTLSDDGWTFINVSDNVTNAARPDYFQPDGTTFPAFEGAIDSYIAANFDSTAGTVIDNWAILPTMTLINGDTFTFYTRTNQGGGFPDAMQVRISLDGDDSTLPTTTDVGSFTTLALNINPDLTEGGYPEEWELQTITITGVPSATDVRIAFRYYIPTDAGRNGNNGSFIGIDSAAIETTLSIEDSVIEGLSSYVDNNSLNLDARTPFTNISIYSITGQEVFTKNLSNTSETIDLTPLSTGMYIAKVSIDGGETAIKFLKE